MLRRAENITLALPGAVGPYGLSSSQGEAGSDTRIGQDVLESRNADRVPRDGDDVIPLAQKLLDIPNFVVPSVRESPCWPLSDPSAVHPNSVLGVRRDPKHGAPRLPFHMKPLAEPDPFVPTATVASFRPYPNSAQLHASLLTLKSDRWYSRLMQAVVIADQLTKTFRVTKKQPGVWGTVKTIVRPERVPVEAVKQVSFQVMPGELVGFLGPNGAGKTTTLKMLTGILHRTGGRAEVLGYDPWERRPAMQRRISLVTGNKMQLWWDLPAQEGFAVLREIYEVPEPEFRARLGSLVETLGIEDKLKVPVRQLSLGERMKCELVAALLHSPEVLFLDEPTLGLDLVSQKRIRDFLKRQNREVGTSILLTSHYMQDVVELCQRVIVIDHGQVVYDGLLAELSKRFHPTRRLRVTFSTPIETSLSSYGEVVESSPLEVTLEVSRSDATQSASRILRELPVEDISLEEPDVEEAIRQLFAENSTPTTLGQ